MIRLLRFSILFAALTLATAPVVLAGEKKGECCEGNACSETKAKTQKSVKKTTKKVSADKA